MSVSGRAVTVLGAGIGGLGCALALARRGARVRVFEQSREIAEVGAGIQISPNGMRVLDALGLGDEVRAGAPRARAVSLRNHADGREVVRLDLARLAPGQDYRFVHRADLIAALATAAREAGVEIRLGRRVHGVEPGRPARLRLAGGATAEADLVIGADGVHSVLRPVLEGPQKARFTGQVAWRAVIDNDIDHPPEARVHMGPGRHLVSYPLRGGAAINLVAVEERAAWTAEGWDHADDPDALRAAFAGFGGRVPAMLGAVESVGLWGLHRHPVAGRWHGAGVALLGDAAHPTLPFLAQGANMALEDAWVLAACLDARDDTDAALARYRSLRLKRVTRVIAAAEGNAWKYHLRNPLIRRSAHLAMGLLGRAAPGRMVRGFDWLYAHDVTREA
ncbi:FAD-dependent monooxygenase [Citreimonas sp.]|uniref:FAD-dependent monooxygenase n=1 Tax=Citreimonas sp. TaxID=3036715 RepID=UPI0035C7B7C0